MSQTTAGEQAARPGLDRRAVLVIPLRQFAPWFAAVVIVTLAGYPGVVCVTPMAWLLALRVGLICMRDSRSPSLRQRLREAALAGALLGVLQGALFAGVLFWLLPLQPSEVTRSLGLAGALLVIGIAASAVLSLITARLEARHLQLPQTS